MTKSSSPIRKDAAVPNTGEAAGAAKNREITVRLQIIEALHVWEFRRANGRTPFGRSIRRLLPGRSRNDLPIDS